MKNRRVKDQEVKLTPPFLQKKRESIIERLNDGTQGYFGCPHLLLTDQLLYRL